MSQYPIVVVKEDKGREDRGLVIEVRSSSNQKVEIAFPSLRNKIGTKANANGVPVDSKPDRLEYEIKFGPTARGARKRGAKKRRRVA